MQADYSYSNAGIRVLEGRILDAETLSRVASQTRADGEKMLSDVGYGAGTTGSCNALIASELSEVRALMLRALPEKLYPILLLPFDAHNMKVLFKDIVADTDSKAYLYDNTVYNTDIVAACCRGGEFSLLSDTIASVLNPAYDSGALTSPFGISTYCEKAIRSEISAVSKAAPQLIIELVRAQADFLNYIAYIRARATKLSAQSFEQTLVPGGDIPAEVFSNAFAAGADDMRSYTFGYPAHFAIMKAQEAAQTSIPAARALLDGEEIKLLEPGRFDTDTPYPIFLYFMKKLDEARRVREAFANMR